MKILIANKFFYPKGGADIVFFDTARLLEAKGHEAVFFAMKDGKNIPSKYERYFVSNVNYGSYNPLGMAKAALRVLYSLEARRNIERLIVDEKPDIAHLHSIYHQISPSIIHSLRKHKIPVVMTLHDYKLVCGSYIFRSHGELCERCKDGAHYQAFFQRCVKDSAAKSLLTTIEMYLHHNIMHIYDKIDVFISPSVFLKNKIAEMGFKGKTVYLPNFIMIEEFAPSYDWTERSIVYLGRLSKEKGVHTLIDAFKDIKGIRLKLVGEGPLKETLEEMVKAERIENVNFLGYKSVEEVREEIRRSMFVVLPSECYENNPRAVMESFALGKPVIGADIGGIPELVKDGETGITFEAFNKADLRLKIESLAGNPDKIMQMGRNARRFVETEFNAEKHYLRLMEIYRMAMENKLK